MNVTHSMDAFVLREMHRRCNYDQYLMAQVAGVIECELIQRSLKVERDDLCVNPRVAYYREQYRRSGLASAVILPHLAEASDVECLTQAHLEALAAIVNGMLAHKPFPLVTVHDEFKAHPNNVNQVRWHYKEILADIAESNVLDDILGQLYGEPGSFNKLSFNLAEQIRLSNYALT